MCVPQWYPSAPDELHCDTHNNMDIPNVAQCTWPLPNGISRGSCEMKDISYVTDDCVLKCLEQRQQKCYYVKQKMIDVVIVFRFDFPADPNNHQPHVSTEQSEKHSWLADSQESWLWRITDKASFGLLYNGWNKTFEKYPLSSPPPIPTQTVVSFPGQYVLFFFVLPLALCVQWCWYESFYARSSSSDSPVPPTTKPTVSVVDDASSTTIVVGEAPTGTLASAAALSSVAVHAQPLSTFPSFQQPPPAPPAPTFAQAPSAQAPLTTMYPQMYYQSSWSSQYQ